MGFLLGWGPADLNFEVGSREVSAPGATPNLQLVWLSVDLQFVWESVEDTPGPHPRPLLQIVCLSVDLQFVWESVEETPAPHPLVSPLGPRLLF